MDRPDYNYYWKSLESDPSVNNGSGMIKRLISADSRAEIHLAIALPKKERLLLIRMPNDWEGKLSNYPRWNGADITFHEGEEKPIRHKHLAIQQSGDSTKEVFETLIADLCDAVLRAKPGQGIENTIISRLNMWKKFFQESKQHGLSLEAQQGLFAELLFMHRFLIPKIGFLKSLRSWTGPDHSNRDFFIDEHAYEIKSSSAKLHQKVTISSERQLDDAGLNLLDLIVVSLDVTDGGEHSLPALVNSIAASMTQHPALAEEFSDKLLEAGYLKIHEPIYRKTYIVRSLNAYRVAEGFPRLLERDLPPGVGDVSYSIMLSACESFRFSIDDSISDLPTDNLREAENES